MNFSQVSLITVTDINPPLQKSKYTWIKAAYKVLKNNKKDMKISDIMKTIKINEYRCIDESKHNMTTLTQLLHNDMKIYEDTKFVITGDGMYGLKSFYHDKNNNFDESLIKYKKSPQIENAFTWKNAAICSLYENNRNMTVKEIFYYIKRNKFRSINENAHSNHLLKLFLKKQIESEKSPFVQTGENEFGLKIFYLNDDGFFDKSLIKYSTKKLKRKRKKKDDEDYLPKRRKTIKEYPLDEYEYEYKRKEKLKKKKKTKDSTSCNLIYEIYRIKKLHDNPNLQKNEKDDLNGLIKKNPNWLQVIKIINKL